MIEQVTKCEAWCGICDAEYTARVWAHDQGLTVLRCPMCRGTTMIPAQPEGDA